MGSGIYSGSHTQIFIGDEGTHWPKELEAAARKMPRWGKDDFVPATEADRLNSAGYRIKAWELKLLAGFAQCYRNALPLNKLPMIPIDFAEIIIKAGGLTAWINSDEKRLRIFWKMADEQTKAAARGPKPQVVKTMKTSRRR